jgi:ADP-ribosylglycohydrolase
MEEVKQSVAVIGEVTHDKPHNTAVATATAAAAAVELQRMMVCSTCMAFPLHVSPCMAFPSATSSLLPVLKRSR